MDRKTLMMMLVLGVLLICSVSSVLAEEEEGEGEEPAWFPLLELAGVIIGIVTLVFTYKTYHAMQGGAVGNTMKYVMILVLVITIAVAFDGLNEVLEFMAEGFMTELIYELLIYIAMIFIAVGSYKTYKIIKQ